MTNNDTGSADHGGASPAPVTALTVLYDANCPLCRTARAWLGRQPALVPLDFVAAGSGQARAMFPELDHAATLRDITVIADNGAIYTHDGAWLACLWALDSYRDLAERLATPALLPVARRVIAAAAGARERRRRTNPDTRYGDRDERQQCTDTRCQ